MHHCVWILLEIFQSLALLPRELLDALHQSLIHLFLRHFDRILRSDFGNNQTGTNTPFGDLTIFGTKLVFALIKILNFFAFALKLMLELMPDLIEFKIDHSWRQFEAMLGVELIKKVLLHMRPRHLRIIRRNLLANRLTEFLEVLHA